jgi:hypothetical protein
MREISWEALMELWLVTWFIQPGASAGICI